MKVFVVSKRVRPTADAALPDDVAWREPVGIALDPAGVKFPWLAEEFTVSASPDRSNASKAAACLETLPAETLSKFGISFDAVAALANWGDAEAPINAGDRLYVCVTHSNSLSGPNISDVSRDSLMGYEPFDVAADAAVFCAPQKKSRDRRIKGNAIK